MLLLAHQLGHKATGTGAGVAPSMRPYSRRRRFSHMHPPVTLALVSLVVALWTR